MRYVFIIAIITLFSVPSYAQRVTYNDLKFCLLHPIHEDEDYFSNKGFSFGGIDTIGSNNNYYIFNFIKNSRHSIDYLCVSKESHNGVFYKSSVFTIIQKDYTLFKSSIVKIGYRFKSTYTHAGNLITVYEKGNYLIEFWIKRNNEYDVTEYSILLVDKLLEPDYSDDKNSN